MSKKKDKKLKPLKKSNRKPVPTVKEEVKQISESKYAKMAMNFIENELPKERDKQREAIAVRDDRITNLIESVQDLTEQLQMKQSECAAYERIINRPVITSPANN